MPHFTHATATIHYDLEGPPTAFPILLIAPGGMRSTIDRWSSAPWNPRTQLAASYRLIGMDQRNAGRSTAPIAADDGWPTMRDDQLALLDHLDIPRCHVIGMCIGGPYVAGLLRAAPERFASAIMLQPVGIEPDGSNRDAFYAMFDAWAQEQSASHPTVDQATWNSFRSNMWDRGFVCTVTPDDIANIETPLLVAMGNDLYHPSVTSRRIVDSAPNATLVEEWKEGAALTEFDAIAKNFLAAHTPPGAGQAKP